MIARPPPLPFLLGGTLFSLSRSTHRRNLVYGVASNGCCDMEPIESLLFVAEATVGTVILYTLPKASRGLPLGVVEETGVTEILQCGIRIRSRYGCLSCP